MDSPDDELVRLGGAANDLRYKLPRLDIGRTPDSTFVDNYISEVGIRYGDLPGLELVVDTQLRPPGGGVRSAPPVPARLVPGGARRRTGHAADGPVVVAAARR